MEWKKKSQFLVTGGITVIIGFLVSYYGLWIVGYYDTRYHELYWPLSMQILGLILMVLGAIVIVIGHLRKE
ncbi:MAG: hypothetical protein GXY70_00010 [Euryarchaeota archaeon]|nr:hypothetical protein [Euryarchaeota archaeon]